MMEAKIRRDLLLVIPVHGHGETILETPCRDYDEYARLPNVIEFENQVFGKTGWNSDSNKACYKTGLNTARVV